MLYFIFGLADFDAEHDPDDDRNDFVAFWNRHIDWIAARFESPDDWLGPRGAKYRESNWMTSTPHPEFVARWRRFEAAHASDTLNEVERLIDLFLPEP
jgi:hypothetical protein